MHGVPEPARLGDPFDEADRALQRADRVVLQTECEREMKQELGVRRALHAGEQRRLDGPLELLADRVELTE